MKPPKMRPVMAKATMHKHVASHVQEVRRRGAGYERWLLVGSLVGIAIVWVPNLLQDGMSAAWLIGTVLTLAIIGAFWGLGYWLMPIIMVRLFDHFHARKPVQGDNP
jgi:hypothetical protein